MKTEINKPTSAHSNHSRTHETGSRHSRWSAKKAAKLLVAAAIATGVGGAGIKYETSPEVRALPKTMPEAVRKQVPSVLKVFNKYGSGIGHQEEGSGVKIGPDLILTAGHVVLDKPTSQIRSGINNSHIAIISKFDPVIRDLKPKLSTETATGWAGTKGRVSGFGVTSPTPDFGLIRVTRSKSFDKVPVVKVAKSMPEKGDPVFFINYQAGRYPTDQQAKVSGVPGSKGGQAEFSGVVLGESKGFIVVATGLQGYGPKPDQQKYLSPGGSGGPVFDSRTGDLIGLSVEAGEYLAGFAPFLYGERLPMSPTSEAGYGFIQPVTPGLIQRYEASLPKVG